MEALVSTDGDVVVVRLSGRVDVETAPPFRKACQEILRGRLVVFDFRQLSFVGSSGILSFLETMQEFYLQNPGGVKFSGVSSEFRKLLLSSELASVEMHESATGAVSAYTAIIAVPLKSELKNDPL